MTVTREGAGLAVLAAECSALLGPDSVITDRQRLRTYECDGLAHHRVVRAVIARDPVAVPAVSVRVVSVPVVAPVVGPAAASVAGRVRAVPLREARRRVAREPAVPAAARCPWPAWPVEPGAARAVRTRSTSASS